MGFFFQDCVSIALAVMMVVTTGNLYFKPAVFFVLQMSSRNGSWHEGVLSDHTLKFDHFDCKIELEV